MNLRARTIRGVVSILLLTFSACRAAEESPAEKLKALATHSGRPIEARLTGFDWPAARLQRAAHASLLDPARLELAGAASSVIQSQLNDSSPRARHESGAAYLLIDRDRDAIDALESAVRQSPKNAAFWSDLAAARYTLAVTEHRPHELPQALADADHALRLNPKLHDALFNRALIIEALGISEAARRAWQRYAATDPSSHWSTEAMRHLGDLRVVTTRDEFQNRLATASRALPHTTPLIALARNFPQESRTWSEGPLLAQWADGFRKGDTKTAAKTLAVVRTLGAALAEFNHVHSVEDIVATIDHANPADTRTLADAHAIYRDGRLLYKERRIADAQRKLKEANTLFARTRSPMTLIGDYYLANCLYDSNHVSDAVQALDHIASMFDARRYPGLAAEIKWEQTICHGSSGEWDAAIRTASESRKMFADLGETENRAQADLLLASLLNRASQPATAWKARTAAFSVLSRTGSSDVIRNSLVSAIYAEAAHGKTEAALALTTLALDDLRGAPQPIGITLAEAARAEALANLGDVAEGRRAIARARLTARTIPDAALQQRTSLAIDIAEAVTDRNRATNVSLRLLSAAVDFYISHKVTAWLPKAYLERGRTHASANDDAAALSDFEAGIRELDAQRAAVGQKDARATFYDTAPELFSESIALLLRDGDVPRAFEFADRARARSVYEHLGSAVDTPAPVPEKQLQEALPSTAVLIEYALLHDAIAIFYITPQRSGVVRVPTTAAVVQGLVERSADLLRQRSDTAAVRATTGALYRLLISPIERELTGADRLILIPDRQLHALPFAALFDNSRQRYLVDDFALSIAPSAASVIRHSSRSASGTVLVVGDPRDENATPLPGATREAETVAAIYNSSTLLSGEQATRARFIAAARQSTIIHYAGHAEDASADPFSVLHLAAVRGDASGDLDATAIAALDLSHAPLVVLAACGTMRGDSEHVEGMPSIARAFLAAGASGVVGTLWEIDDDTAAPLFHRMHVALHNGASPAAALRTAQLALAHDPDTRLSNPASWAAVELLGCANEQAATGRRRSE
jgi:CHAT domain-containing protein/tetratricopeptide (TPR) repeat protein